MLIDAFAQEFGNEKDVCLKLHGRSGLPYCINAIKRKLQDINAKNIILIEHSFNNDEHVHFMSSLDCYVFVSKGEGFSITPREALALGIPCILTNHTAHSTICNTGYVRPVLSDIMEPAYYDCFGSYCGYQFNTSTEELRQALRDVYNNYKYYLKKAHKGREWVRDIFIPI